MKNKNIVSLSALLTPMMLDIEKSSARRRFIRLIKDFVEDYEVELNSIKNEFANKNPDGTKSVIDNQIQYTNENRKKAASKIKELQELVIEVDCSSNSKDKAFIILILTDIVGDLEKNKEFTTDTFDYIETIKEIIEDLQ